MSKVAAASNYKAFKMDPLEADEGDGVSENPLMAYLPARSKLCRVRDALLEDGFCVLKSILTPDECQRAVDDIWDFVEDVSSGMVKRTDPPSWYPSSEDGIDPWPHTGYKSFSDMFQSNGAGFVMGSHVREALAERVFEPLYQTRELHCSKEGFTFHRPTASQDTNSPPKWWVDSILSRDGPMVCSEKQIKSVGEHYDQPHSSVGLHTIQSMVSLEDQEEGVDGCFLCYPRSHGKVHQALTSDIYRGQFTWIPLTDDELFRLEDEFQLTPKRIYLSKGDVILWRSDLLHAPLPPQGLTSRFRAVAYTCMQPACLTPASVIKEKMDAYKQRHTGDHRPHVESWHSHRRRNTHRPHYRTSPPLVSIRMAELYGLIPYTHGEEELASEMKRALIRGVRFRSTDPVEKNLVRPCPARLQHISARTDSNMVGQDKYMGGVASPCGTYIYGVPGTARRVLRVNTVTHEMDWVGESYEGKFKWLRGVEIPADVMRSPSYPKGCCLALPSNASSVLKINPETNEVFTFGAETMAQAGETGWYYHGGNLADNGMVYAIPANADRVLKIDPRTDELKFIGPCYPGKQKWFGGIVGTDRKIYGIPHNEVGVLQIDPETDSCRVLMKEDGSPLPSGQWKWHGGLAAGDKIYGFPNNASEILVIDTRQGRVYTVGDETVLQSGRHRIPQDGRYKYLGGALTLDERYAYLFPCDAERVLRIDTTTDEVSLVGPELLDGENKYQNGFVARDGCLYGIPQRATGILRITPPGVEGVGEEEHVDILYCGEEMVGVKDKFEGGVMGLDENIYCIPLRCKTCVKIIPGPSFSK